MQSSQIERLVSSLIELLEAGTAPWRREWDPLASGHHVNLRSGRRYRGCNPILLTMGMHLRGSALPYWCGFGEARSLGLVPRPGSKAVTVLRPQRHRPASADAEDCGWVSYRPVPVFNAADLEGEALPALLARLSDRVLGSGFDNSTRLAHAEAVLAAWPVPVTHGSDRACYLPAADRIVLPVRCAFHSAAAYLATWAHEAVHSTGHPSRLHRDLSGGPSSATTAREELVAELGSVLVGDRLEIGSDLANHASYLASWIDLLQASPRLLLHVLAEARRAADLIAPESATDCRKPAIQMSVEAESR